MGNPSYDLAAWASVPWPGSLFAPSTTRLFDQGSLQVGTRTAAALNLEVNVRFAQLHSTGATGCTALEHPGGRLAAYVHRLRRRGLSIATLERPNQGVFPGYHAAYVLLSKVSGLPILEAAAWDNTVKAEELALTRSGETMVCKLILMPDIGTELPKLL